MKWRFQVVTMCVELETDRVSFKHSFALIKLMTVSGLRTLRIRSTRFLTKKSKIIRNKLNSPRKEFLVSLILLLIMYAAVYIFLTIPLKNDAEDQELSYSTTPAPVLEPLVAESIVLSPSGETLRPDDPSSPTTPTRSQASEPEEEEGNISNEYTHV